MKHLITLVCTISLLAAFGCEEKPAADAPAETSAAETGAEAAETTEDGAAEEGEKADEPEAPAESGATGQKGLPDDMKPGDAQQYGASFTIEDEPVALADVLAQADDNVGKTIKVSAKLDKVCKKKGCWFTLAGDGIDQTVRVRMKDYGFFVPRNAEGAAAVAEGVLEKKVVPQKEAQHYADESGSGDKVLSDQTEYHFIATAVHLTKAAS
jgi:hypothetical protein